MTTVEQQGRRKADIADRMQFMDDTVQLLTPGSQRVHSRSPRVRDGEAMLVAGRNHPRLLVPAKPRRAAAAALRRAGTPRSTRDRLRTTLLSGTALVGLAPLIFSERVRRGPHARPGLLDHLSDVLGSPLLAAVQISPARANRKPVLALLARDGRPIGFAKVGTTELSRLLVTTEAASLDRVAMAGLVHVDAPRVLWRGLWRDIEVLVQSPVPAWRTGPVGEALLHQAMAETSHVFKDVDATVSDYLGQLHRRVAAACGPALDAERPSLDDIAAVLNAIDCFGPVGELTVGAWHGDWTPWNCGELDGRVVVWDWERLATPAPCGFDQLHYVFFSWITKGRTYPDAGPALLDLAPKILERWGLDPAVARATAALYLLDLAVRYVHDRQRAVIPRLARLDEWAITPAAQALTGHHLNRKDSSS